MPAAGEEEGEEVVVAAAAQTHAWPAGRRIFNSRMGPLDGERGEGCVIRFAGARW